MFARAWRLQVCQGADPDAGDKPVGDCCVFCSYSDQLCLPKQQSRGGWLGLLPDPQPLADLCDEAAHEREYAAERDAAVPEHRGKRHVSRSSRSIFVFNLRNSRSTRERVDGQAVIAPRTAPAYPSTSRARTSRAQARAAHPSARPRRSRPTHETRPRSPAHSCSRTCAHVADLVITIEPDHAANHDTPRAPRSTSSRHHPQNAPRHADGRAPPRAPPAALTTA